MNRGGIGEVQIDHILYAVLQLTAHTEVKSNASSIFIIFDIADESQVAIGYLGSVFGLHDPVIDPEYLDADFDFFLGGTKRVDHFADRFVELFRRGRAVRAERRILEFKSGANLMLVKIKPASTEVEAGSII